MRVKNKTEVFTVDEELRMRRTENRHVIPRDMTEGEASTLFAVFPKMDVLECPEKVYFRE